MSETNNTPLSEKEMEEIVERAVAPAAASAPVHPDDEKPLLKITDLEVTFTSSTGIVPAVRGANLTIYPGQTVAIVGESGSGKSTTAAAVIGLLPGTGKVAGGTIEFDGQDITNLSTNEWVALRGSGIGLVPQDPMSNLNPVLRVGYQVKEALLANNVVPKSEVGERVTQLLEEAGLPDAERRAKQFPHEFSGGMRQRVVIAIAVACSPKILICDEPTTALDVTIQAQILQLLKEMRFKYDLTIVMITHDLGVVANIADRVAVMYAGDIVEIGTADEIYYDPRHPYTWALLSSMPQMGVKGEDLFNIVGTPPNLFAEIRGDAFAPRNPQALKIDFVKRPPYFEVTPTHKAKTWLLDPRAPKIEPPAAVKMLREEGL